MRGKVDHGATSSFRRIALAIALIAAPVANADAAPRSGLIAFSRQIDGGGANIFLARPDGSKARQVRLPHPAEDFGAPVFSPGSTRLLISHTLRFNSAGDLLPFRPLVVDVNGHHATLLDPPGAPFDMLCRAWSPDGRRLLCGFGGTKPGLFTIRATDGGHPVRLTTTPADVQETPGDFSPDGHHVVLIRTSPGTEQTALFTVRTDGTQLKQLTPYGAEFGHEFADARWSPDGRDILFASPQGKLLLAHPDRPGLSTIDLAVPGPYFALAPAWSPDGTKIVFSMSVNGQEDIYTANRDGSDVTQVTATPGFEPFADWGG
ncbi:hypothetical protein [Actinocrispum sp. NPDC049592]|uniref:TolB family protein n=1 Tax=Actinocrispum sp. NPDC049592 TaxID=3154835 RepID=UPI003448443F